MVRGIQADKIETVGVMIIHVTYSESSYFSLLGDICLITDDHQLWKILIYYRFFQFYFLNKDISVTVYVIDLIFSVCIPNIQPEGRVSQIFDLGPSFYFMSKIR